MKKRVLLLAPPYMDIYKDIISGLESLDYEVVWVSDGLVPGNPYNKNDISRKTKTIEQYQTEVDSFWNEAFGKPEYALPFDVFLAIDGFMVTPHLFQVLKDKNPKIKNILYLYDRVEGNYEIDIFFPYYTNVYSFDLGDCAHYGLHHLPIYWVDSDEKVEQKYDISAVAGFSFGTRYEVFKRFKTIAKEKHLKDYIKLVLRPVENPWLYRFKCLIYRLKGKPFLTLSDMQDDLFTTHSLTPSDFRLLIRQSCVVVDTQNSNQDGLTARCMWALGAEKKIITTNKAVKQYPFYSPDQFFVLNNSSEGLVSFLASDFKMSNEVREIIKQYRIDNWLRLMVN